MKILILLFLVTVFFSCKKDQKEESPDLGYNYYPAALKSYIIYDVDSIVYNPLGLINDTMIYKFQIKEKIDSILSETEAAKTVKIIRFKKNYSQNISYDSLDWFIQDVWFAEISKTKVVVNEENVRLIKLAFPVVNNSYWDGNAENTLGEQRYKYFEVDKPLTLNNKVFETTLTVKQEQSTSAISLVDHREQYAKDYGLISKTIINYSYYVDAQGILHPNVIYNGLYYKMSYNNSGVE